MGKLTPRKIAALAGLVIIIAVYLNSWLFSLLLFSEKEIIIRLIVAIGSGLVAYVFTRRVINTFLETKIKHIYQLIFRQDNPNSTMAPPDPDLPLLKEVEDEVSLYLRNQKQEMNTLRHLEKYRQDYVGNVAHELKTPIFNIQGYVYTLKEGGALEDPSVNKLYLQKASDNIDRMIKIIEDLDSIYKLESNQLTLEWENIQLDSFIETMLDELKLMAKEKSITLSYRKEFEEPAWVKADPDYLRQIFINLIENSIKYGRAGGETIIILLDLETKILIEVKDNGVGIESKHLRHIFDRFYRVDVARSRQAGGSGLGLSIVKHIIEAHEQSIQVRSTAGAGTTFSFTLDKIDPLESDQSG